MSRRILYMAHPVGGDVPGNVRRALDWLASLRRSEPNVTIIAPWLASLASGENDADPVARERGMIDCETVVARCDGLILVGGRISAGMQRELAAAVAADIDVDDLTKLGTVAPHGTHRALLDSNLKTKRGSTGRL
jgi:hypothetical protein